MWVTITLTVPIIYSNSLVIFILNKQKNLNKSELCRNQDFFNACLHIDLVYGWHFSYSPNIPFREIGSHILTNRAYRFAVHSTFVKGTALHCAKYCECFIR